LPLNPLHRRALCPLAPGALLSLALLSLALPSRAAPRQSLEPIDALSTPAAGARSLALGPQDEALLRPGVPLHVHEALGVPTFLFSSRQNPASRARLQVQSVRRPSGGEAEAQARAHLGDYAHLYRMAPSDVAALELRELHDLGDGPIIARFGQRLGGVEVFREEVKVAMDRGLGLVSLSGAITGDAAGLAPPPFRLTAREALSLALEDLHGTRLSESDVSPRAAGDYTEFSLAPASPVARAVAFPQPARAKKIYFHHAGRYEPAYYVELFAGAAGSNSSEAYRYAVSAETGALLLRHDMVYSDGFGYRVWASTGGLHTPYDGPQGTGATPFPAGVAVDGYKPVFQPQQLITQVNAPALSASGLAAASDPWLPAGATSTSGNNVDAYADLSAPDGFSSGDFRADITAAGLFDRTYDTGAGPLTSVDQQKAAITQLFYNTNYFHDWYYVAGFTEAAGNAQASNYGRGGKENDVLHAEAQDYSGTDNANMYTPADGASPRMQMYVWRGTGLPGQMEIVAPASLAGKSATLYATFGPESFDLTGTLAPAVSNGSTLVCGPITNASAVSGKIALLDRGDCNFINKVQYAQAAGAAGVVIVNNLDVINLGGMAGTGGPEDLAITIPVMMMEQAVGTKVRAALAAGTPVTVHMLRSSASIDIDRDGTIDNTVVAHEWGHYINHRLIFDSSGLGSNMSDGMGEGWADFHAMLMVVRAEDKAAAGNDSWQGSYGLAAYAQNGDPRAYYWGIRRFPYSTDFAKNPLTYKHVTVFVPIPTTAPSAYVDPGNYNSEVHNTGEVWANMLWGCYSNLLNDPRYTFEQARDKMRNLIVASYKLTPSQPSFPEARDALLAAALAGDPSGGDWASFYRAFARRGLGPKAGAPDRNSLDNSGATEDFTDPTGNKPPTARVGADQTAMAHALVTLDGSGSSDPEGAALTYSWLQTAGPTASFSPNVARPSFKAPNVATDRTLTFTLTVSDGQNTSLAVKSNVLVHPSNQAPTAAAGPAQSVPSDASKVTLDGSASSDPDGDPLTYTWKQTAGPGVSLVQSGGPKASFTPGGSGKYTFQLVVNDGVADSAASSVDVTVSSSGCSSASSAWAALLGLVPFALRRRKQ
jgi:large repetitive protein